MKKIKTITISLPDPCAEDWEQMTPTGCGRFCRQCQKNVIDCTMLPDDLVARLFSNPSNGQLCGRFAESQLNRAIEVPEAPAAKNWIQRLSAAAVLVAPYFTALPATAQQASVAIVSTKDTAASKPIRIKGKITDAITQDPMIKMAIHIEGLETQYSDRHGRFSFIIPDDWVGKTLTLNATYRPLSTASKDHTIILEEVVKIEAGKRLYETNLMRYPAGSTAAMDTVSIEASAPVYKGYMGGGGAPVITERMIYKPSLWRRISWLFAPKKRNR